MHPIRAFRGCRWVTNRALDGPPEPFRRPPPPPRAGRVIAYSLINDRGVPDWPNVRVQHAGRAVADDHPGAGSARRSRPASGRADERLGVLPARHALRSSSSPGEGHRRPPQSGRGRAIPASRAEPDRDSGGVARAWTALCTELAGLRSPAARSRGPSHEKGPACGGASRGGRSRTRTWDLFLIREAL
jgi:hypothetical protein